MGPGFNEAALPLVENQVGCCDCLKRKRRLMKPREWTSSGLSSVTREFSLPQVTVLARSQIAAAGEGHEKSF